MSRLISAPQKGFMTSLVNERLQQLEANSVLEGLNKVAKFYGYDDIDDMTLKDAIAAIRTLKEYKPDGFSEDLPPAVAEAERYFKPNRYRSRRGEGCLACGEVVQAEEGYAITGVPDQTEGWGLIHAGACANTTATERMNTAEQTQVSETIPSQ